MNYSKPLILIPARFESERFPGKPLIAISNDEVLVERVLKKCLETGWMASVVTDHDSIEKYLKDKSLPVVRVDDNVASGTERIGLAYDRFFKNQGYDLVINVQGDEPCINSFTLKEMVKNQAQTQFDVFTLVAARRSSEEGFHNTNIVKALYEPHLRKCFYFSRQAVPFSREGKPDYTWYQHIGVYSYQVNALKLFLSLEPSENEKLEKLEQLRGLDNGLTYGACLTQETMIGVDTPEDLAEVAKIMKGKTNESDIKRSQKGFGGRSSSN